MTPKEKAKELRDKYLPIVDYGQTEANNYAKKGALIAVDGVLIRNEDFLREWKYENERKYPTWHIAAVVIAFWAAVFAGIYLLL